MPPIVRPSSHRPSRRRERHLVLLVALACGLSLAAPASWAAKPPRTPPSASRVAANVSGTQGQTAKVATSRKRAVKAARKRAVKAARFLRRQIADLRVSAATATNVSLSWRVSPNATGVIGYVVTKDGVTVAKPTVPRAVVSGMQCGTTATVGVRAKGLWGALSAPAWLTVATSPCPDTIAPSAPTNLTLAGRTTSVLSLSWLASNDNVGVVAYEVFVGSRAAGSTAETAMSVGNLVCGKTYSLGVHAVDGAGNTSALAVITASTSDCPDTQAPSTPTLAAVLNGDRAQLSWSASSDNVAVVKYVAFQGNSPLVETTALQYTTGVLACGQTYTFRVEAQDAAGNRSGSGTATVTTAVCPAPPPPAQPSGDTSPPSAPGSLHVTSVTATSISLGWSASGDNVGVTGYGVYRNGTLDHSATGLSSSLTGLTCGTTYALGVDAADSAGNRSSKSEISTSTAPCADSQPPTTPSNLHTTSVTQTSAAFAWNPSTDDVGVVGYGVYGSGLKVADTTDTSFVLTSLTCGTVTTVEIDAVDGSGNRSSKASLLISTPACPDTQAPGAPTGLQVTSVTQTSLTFSWNAATDNVGVTGYDVYRNGTQVGSTTATLSKNLTGLACGTSYTLGVEALDAAGNRSPRTGMTVETTACSSPPPPASSTANLFVSPTGSDSTCTRYASGPSGAPAACATFAGAYAKAQPGDIVEVAGGTYGGQTLNRRGLGAPAVVFRPASGAAPTLTDVNLHSSYVEVQGMRLTGGVSVEKGSDGVRPSFVTVRDVTALSAFIAADDVLFKGGSYGGFDACDTKNPEDGIEIWLSGSTASNRVTLDGVMVHDVSDHNNVCAGTAGAGRHVDCVQVLAGHYITIRNSRFYGCATSNIIARPYIDGLDHVTIENNVFEPVTNPGNNVYLGGPDAPCNAMVFRNNTSRGGGVTGGCPNESIQVYNNIMTTGACVSQMAYANNVFLPSYGTACGSASKRCQPAFASDGFHLLATDTCARDAGDPARYSTTDIDGNARPSGSAPDIGADESG